MKARGSSGVIPYSLIRNARTRCWYSGQLDAMGERPLREAAANGGEAYRFLWLRTFHRPVMIRIFARDDQVLLEAKETDGHGGYAPGALDRTARRLLSMDEWKQFLHAVQQSEFWSGEWSGGDECLDGSMWILEGVRGTEHRLLEVQGCWTNTELKQPRPLAYRPGEVLIKLARLWIPADELY